MACLVDTSIDVVRVVRELERLVMERGLPRVIVSDNGCDLLVALGAPYAQQCGRVLYTQEQRFQLAHSLSLARHFGVRKRRQARR